MKKKKNNWIIASVIFLCLGAFLFVNLQKNSEKTVVVYASVDQVFSEPVLKDFEKKSGIKVMPVYDVEASKTTGLVNRLIEEKASPRADVFWSGEFAQTIMLKEKDVLDTYISSAASDIPDGYKDNEGYWTGFGGRARVLLVNTKLLQKENYPSSIFDLLKPEYEGKTIGMAYPMFGTTATQAAALYAKLGPEKALEFYNGLSQKKIRIYDGNSVVRDMVVSGEIAIGLTDTDDSLGAIQKGEPVEMIFPDQKEGQIGTLIVPNTVALIKGAPHKENAKAFIDYLLSREVEAGLIKSGWINLSMRTGDSVATTGEFNAKGMDTSLYGVYEMMQKSRDELQKIFLR